MQNENLENNKAGQVRRNPSRDNKNINQGQNYEKRVDSETGSNGNAKTDKKEFTGNENSVDGGRVSDTSGNNTDYGRSGKTQQNAAGENESGFEQTGSQGLQNSRGAQGSNSQGQSEQQQSKKQSGESSGGVKNDEAQKAGSGASYDANEQFDDDEDYGSNVQGASGAENQDRQNASGGQGTLNNMQKNQFEQRQKDKNQENSTRQ